MVKEKIAEIHYLYPDQEDRSSSFHLQQEPPGLSGSLHAKRQIAVFLHCFLFWSGKGVIFQMSTTQYPPT